MSLTIVKHTSPDTDDIGCSKDGMTKRAYIEKKAVNFKNFLATKATNQEPIEAFSKMTITQLIEYFVIKVSPYKNQLSVPTLTIMVELGISKLDTDAYNKIHRYMELFLEIV